jgi:4-amino-4-deoxy-L-arabinose transferase-like glycosyltransferase
LGLLGGLAFLVFYNLEVNPRPWHDEGAALSLAKTLANEGVYAVRTSEGYQTFGPVQSVGPTVLLPVALSFKLNGVGLVQARIVAAGYALLTLVVFYCCGLELFGWQSALVSTLLLLASPTAGFLLFGRQVLGEVPALGFFLAGWLAWARGMRTKRAWLYPIAGLLMGAAMVTKTQYVLIGLGTLALLVILDLFYYRQGNLGNLIVVGLTASACVAAWLSWQIMYFGIDVFQENAGKLGQLANSTTGFHLRSTVEALQVLLGSSAPIYNFWALPALLYLGLLSARRDRKSFALAFLLIFSCLWLSYFTFWIIPWQRYALAAVAIVALFVGKLYSDLATAFFSSWEDFWKGIRQFRLHKSFSSQKTLLTLGTSVALITMGLLTINQAQKIVRTDVLDRVGVQIDNVKSPPQFQAPHQIAAYLKESVDKQAVIETWDRELDVLTDHRYHFPDQAHLAKTHAAVYRGGSREYGLGEDYFGLIQPSYVVIGWYGRFNRIYDMEYLTQHSDLLVTIGQDGWRYDVYEFHLDR